MRKSLKKEIKQLRDRSERILCLKKPHAFAKGYMDGLRVRRRVARDSLSVVEGAILLIENGAAKETGKPKSRGDAKALQ
jgi:hypothetical protein